MPSLSIRILTRNPSGANRLNPRGYKVLARDTRGGFTNENYLSMVALIRFGSFDYLWANDLGGGHMDEACTGRSTNQVNLETPLAKALTPGGTTPACTREASRAARFAILSSLSSTLLAAKTLRSQTPFRRGRVSMRRI